MKKYYKLFILIFYCSACSQNKTEISSPSQLEILNLPGKYRLEYYPDFISKSGWDYNLVHREELLYLKHDSSFMLERIYHQGGFQKIPQSGTWTVTKNNLILSSGRLFVIEKNSIKEPKCAERDDLSNIPWNKE